MNEIIAEITNEIIAELTADEHEMNEENFVEYLKEYYNTSYFHLMTGGRQDRAMVRLVAIKQMLDTLSHFDK